MSGSSEVLAKYGINTKEAAVSQEALNNGWDPSALTEQQKAMARLAIIAKTLGEQGAIGDAAKTAGSFANVLKKLRASAIDMGTAIGRQLLPPLTAAAARLSRTRPRWPWRGSATTKAW